MNNLFMKVGCSVIVGLDVFPSLIVLVCSYLFGKCIGGGKACSWNMHSIEHGEGGGAFWLHSPSHGLSLFFLLFLFSFSFFFFFFLFLFSFSFFFFFSFPLHCPPDPCGCRGSHERSDPH
ncbi:hypothetical protein BDV30DRAFT_43245 [Aspergillus minisclerotigenes]|uniref:Uncharacterized protein n=1 Tax=Aspergillus minisclerotigenes TaxID=656917 RepID=A0A5N6IKR2_9EURO|nr:hypothetical protein BDV30DRAFT_43245 [Aspergillus minisclerotigenes]